MLLSVNESLCIGCGLCAKLCPAQLTIDDQMIARVLPGATDNLDEDGLEMLEAAIDYCPVDAIVLAE